MTIDRPFDSLPAEIAFKLVDRTQRGNVALPALLEFLQEFYGPGAASEMVSGMALRDPKAMAVWVASDNRPISLPAFRALYHALPPELKEDVELLVQQSKKYTVRALRDEPAPAPTSPFFPPLSSRLQTHHIHRRKLLAMQFACALSLTVVAPLERVQMWRQTAAACGSQEKPGLRRALATLWRRDGGWRGLLRGNSLAVARILPAALIQWPLMDRLCAQRPHGGLYWEIQCGAAAGVAAAVLTHPLDVLRVRAAVTPGPSCSVAALAANLVRTEGVRPLMRGVVPSTLGMFPYVGVNFGMYYYYALQRSTKATDSPLATPSLVFWAGAGAAAHQLMVHPLDTCRRVMQSEAGAASGGMLQTLQGIYAAQGLKGLYSGLVPAMLRIPPALAASVTAWNMYMTRVEK